MTFAQAAVLAAPRDLQLQEIALPAVEANTGILRVQACGLCGSDYEQWLGTEEGHRAKMPIIPGHEIIGVIEDAGDRALREWGMQVGQRVAVEGVIPCGHCPSCIAGVAKRCSRQRGYGIRLGLDSEPGLWGGYATHLHLESGSLLHRLPSDLPAGLMVMFNPLSNAVRWTCEVGGVGLGDTVAICGPGQRGLLSVVAAREAGARTIIVTGTARDRDRLALASALGASATVVVDDDDPVAVVQDLTSGLGVDVVVDVSHGSTKPVVQAVDMVRPGGRVVLGGLKQRRPVDGLVSDVVAYKEVTMIGVFSAGWSAIETAIRILEKCNTELAALATHAFGLQDAADAVRILGRETSDGTEPICVHLAMT